MKSKKVVILATSILLIISIGVYSQFFNELEGIPIQEEEQGIPIQEEKPYLPITINDQTTLYEIHKIDGKNLIKYEMSDLFNVYSSVEGADIGTVSDEIQKRIDAIELPKGYRMNFQGEIATMKKSFGAKVVVTLNNGKKIIEQLDRADAHPYGARPFKRQNYINKFLTLTEGIIDKRESNRFLKMVQNLKNLKSGQLDKLNIEIKKSNLKRNLKKGIF